MTKMSKTEAAEIIAIDVRVWARKTGLTHASQITKDLVEARLSELGCGAPQYAGSYKEAAALAAPSWRTILRLARKDAL